MAKTGPRWRGEQELDHCAQRIPAMHRDEFTFHVLTLSLDHSAEIWKRFSPAIAHHEPQANQDANAVANLPS